MSKFEKKVLKKRVFEKRVLFVGIPDMAYVCLDGLNLSDVNIVGVVGPKEDHPTYLNFQRFVKSRNLNFIEYETLDDFMFIQQIKNLNADIAVVCSFNYKIPKVLLDCVKGGFINIHPSLLPEYRGPNPYSSVIINDEKETGVTLHFMDETFDTGDIIAQRKLPMTKLETMGTLFNRLNILGLDMLLETLTKYEKEPLNRQKQPQGTFKRGKSMSNEAIIIDYEKSAGGIESLIRSLNPFVLAQTSFRGNIIKVFTADIIEQDFHLTYSPGEIVQIEDEKFYIKTGKGLLAITSMQFGSFFTGTSKEFIKILKPKIGERFL